MLALLPMKLRSARGRAIPHVRLLVLGLIALAAIVSGPADTASALGSNWGRAFTVDDLGPGFTYGVNPGGVGLIYCPGPGEFYTKSWNMCWQDASTVSGGHGANGHFWYTWNCLSQSPCPSNDHNWGRWTPDLWYTGD